MKQKQKGADWVAWVLQFIFGFLVGALGSLFFVGRGRRSLHLVASDQTSLFVAGLGLIVAAVGSYYGDTLWSGDFRLIPPDAPQHSRASRWASLISGIAGVGLVAGALASS